MKVVLFRTSSVPSHIAHAPGSPHLSVSVSVQDLVVAYSGDKKVPLSPRTSIHMDVSRRRIRRRSSESDIIRSEARMLTKHRSRSFHAPPLIPEEHCDVANRKAPAGGISWEDLGFPGGGMNKNRNSGGGGGGYGENRGDQGNIAAYYETMIKSDPMNTLLLRNYGKYLHEVEGELVKAEEYYGRAILASPGDGDVLSLYGKLIWETHRDEGRAKSYFHQALQVSPNDCSILGSYAHFMWEAEEEQDEEEEDEVVTSSAMVKTF